MHCLKILDINFQIAENTVLVKTAEVIEQLLENMGHNLSHYVLEFLGALQSEEIRVIRDLRDVLETPISDEYILARSRLNI